MKYYVGCTLADGTAGYFVYDGMNQADITTLLASFGASNIQFLDQATWQTGLAAQKLAKQAE